MAEIIRHYASVEHAEGALEKLRAAGLSDATGPTPVSSPQDVATPQGAASAAGTTWRISVRPPFGTAQRAIDIVDAFGPTAPASSRHHQGMQRDHGYERDHGPGIDAISRLSGPVSPGSISSLSGSVDARAIAAASRSRPVGAIATLSGRRSAGSISKLSGHVSPGAISRLSQPGASGAIAGMSSGWYASRLLGLPLLTESQAPLEPDESLLTDRQGSHRG